MITMKVSLIANTSHPEEVITLAAKMCYSNKTIDEMSIEEYEDFIKRLMELGHESPIEHVTFTFGIEGISRSASHQLVRHRIASYSQKSQRYVKEDQFDYVVPPTIEGSCAEDRFKKLMGYIQAEYNSIRNDIIAELEEQGVDKKSTEKIANEDARYVLPNACQTSLVVTMNARSLFNFFKLRCCNRAQWEIRELANEMYRICYMVAPTLFMYAGPGCVVNGRCSEGKMSCGLSAQKIREFDVLRKRCDFNV
jgi:thymidylate synthase (FAD)